MAVALACVPTAQASYQRICAPSGAPILCEIHHQVKAVHRLDHYLGRPRTRYGWSAERSSSAAYRAWARHEWYARHRARGRLARLPVAEIIRYLWPDSSQQFAISIASCESGLRAYADNPTSTATGVFQILGGSTNPWWNTRQALRMWASRGWEPWYASIGCWG